VQTKLCGGGVVVVLLCRSDDVVGSVMTSRWQGHGVLGLAKESEARRGRAVAAAVGSR
jgi:hypothetical protein